MKYLVLMLGTAILLCGRPGPSDGGARDGKQRWTFLKTGAAKGNAPLKVPGVANGLPGKVELKIVFKAKEVAEFVIIGDGDTGIELYVYDSKGKLVAKDADPDKQSTDLRLCEWTPQEEEEFRIVLVNRGKVYNMVQAGCN